MMHMRKRDAGRSSDTFNIGEEKSLYKYLGCVVDEFLDCSSMVGHQVKLGSQAGVHGCGGVGSQWER